MNNQDYKKVDPIKQLDSFSIDVIDEDDLSLNLTEIINRNAKEYGIKESVDIDRKLKHINTIKSLGYIKIPSDDLECEARIRKFDEELKKIRQQADCSLNCLAWFILLSLIVSVCISLSLFYIGYYFLN